MKGFVLFRNVAMVLLIFGLFFSLTTEKGFFLMWLTNYRSVVADYYFYYVTRLAEPIGYIICAVVLSFYSWRKMIAVPLLGGVVLLTSYLMKEFFQHERPAIYLERMCYEGPLAVFGYPLLSGHHSFPSGHSMGAWALFTLVAALTKQTWMSVVCLFLALSVSISRIYLLEHFLEDVVAGGSVGIALGYGVYYLYTKFLLPKSTSASESSMMEKT